jgi:hypothetical protein
MADASLRKHDPLSQKMVCFVGRVSLVQYLLKHAYTRIKASTRALKTARKQP